MQQQQTFWEQRLLFLADLIQEGKLPVYRLSDPSEALPVARRIVPPDRSSVEAADILRRCVDRRVLTQAAFFHALTEAVAWELEHLHEEAAAARIGCEPLDWTAGPEGPDTSPLFKRMALEFSRFLVDNAATLVTKGTLETAYLLVGALARSYRFGPVWPETWPKLVTVVAGGKLSAGADAAIAKLIRDKDNFYTALSLDTEPAVTWEPIELTTSATAWFLEAARDAAVARDFEMAQTWLRHLGDGAALSEEAFVQALTDNDWRPEEIARAVAEVREDMGGEELYNPVLDEHSHELERTLAGRPRRVVITALLDHIKGTERS